VSRPTSRLGWPGPLVARWQTLRAQWTVAVSAEDRAAIDRAEQEARARKVRVAAWMTALLCLALMAVVDLWMYRVLGYGATQPALSEVVLVRAVVLLLAATYLWTSRPGDRVEGGHTTTRRQGLLFLATTMLSVAAVSAFEWSAKGDLDSFVISVFVTVTFLRLRPAETVLVTAPGLALLTAWIGLGAEPLLVRLGELGNLVLVAAAAIVTSALAEALNVRAHIHRLENERQGAALAVMNARLADVNEQLQRMAWRDPLTGVANRRAFDEAYAAEWLRALREGDSLAVIMIDIDWFKGYNDTYGHAAGDDCLKQVAALLGSTCHRPGDLAARYGGEEFVLLLPRTTTAGAWAVAETARRTVRERALAHGASPLGVVTVSLGVAACRPMFVSDRHALQNAADMALYTAKRAGRDRVEEADSLVLIKEIDLNPLPANIFTKAWLESKSR